MSAGLRIAHVVPVTEAEGPFRRLALWTRGCRLRCPGCCNPELFEATGPVTPVAALVATIERARARHDLEGITVVGGEPLEQLPAIAELCAAVSERGLGVLLFTGYRKEEAAALPGFAALQVDTLVDGRFDAGDLEPPLARGGRRFVGSRNQRLHHFTGRYADMSLWTASNQGAAELEIHVSAAGQVTLVGAPRRVARAARELS
ncbi:MAG: radical SAM protein [Myxococcales bacterium]|nr:radical SAM protein [Myxococcales bacterium]